MSVILYFSLSVLFNEIWPQYQLTLRRRPEAKSNSINACGIHILLFIVNSNIRPIIIIFGNVWVFMKMWSLTYPVDIEWKVRGPIHIPIRPQCPILTEIFNNVCKCGFLTPNKMQIRSNFVGLWMDFCIWIMQSVIILSYKGKGWFAYI